MDVFRDQQPSSRDNCLDLCLVLGAEDTFKSTAIERAQL